MRKRMACGAYQNGEFVFRRITRTLQKLILESFIQNVSFRIE